MNFLNCDINIILIYLEFELKYVSLKNRFFKRLNTYEDEIKFTLAAKETKALIMCVNHALCYLCHLEYINITDLIIYN